jgi:hypothetical protein
MFRTEYEFRLPKGYVDSDGELHRDGVMRLATAADEILPLADPRVEKNPAYLLIILFSRVVTSLGRIKQITPKTIESLFTEDLAFLQQFFNEINGVSKQRKKVQCPNCRHEYVVELAPLGESAAIP